MEKALNPLKLKEKAEAILRESGIPVTYAYEWFYRQVITHHGLPYDSEQPNKTTALAMEEARQGKGETYDSVDSMFAELEE
jgi:DNA-damage-inducible protein J